MGIGVLDIGNLIGNRSQSLETGRGWRVSENTLKVSVRNKGEGAVSTASLKYSRGRSGVGRGRYYEDRSYSRWV